jgi:hypothetical protein
MISLAGNAHNSHDLNETDPRLRHVHAEKLGNVWDVPDFRGFGIKLGGAPGPTRTPGLRIRSPFWSVFRKLTKINIFAQTLMDIDSDHDQQFVHLIHEKQFLPPICPQITPKIFRCIRINSSNTSDCEKSGKSEKRF